MPRNYRGHYLVTMKRELVEPENKDKVKFAVALEAFKIKEADEALEALKRDDADPKVLIAVLLATDDIKSLKKAYPNYLGSTSQFDKFLNKHIK